MISNLETVKALILGAAFAATLTTLIAWWDDRKDCASPKVKVATIVAAIIVGVVVC